MTANPEAMPTIPVLDKGYVRLVDRMGGDLSVVRAAKVSYSHQWDADEQRDVKLIRYLMAHQHTSPFEHVVFTFEVKAPLFVLRQWHRHRTWSYNEESARYRENVGEFYVPKPVDIGFVSPTNKQGRVFDGLAPWHVDAVKKIAAISETAVDYYTELLEQGTPREVARMVLPLNVYSTMFATVDLHNLLHFIRLRDDPHAQWEIAEYARALRSLAQPFAPISFQAFEDSRHAQ